MMRPCPTEGTARWIHLAVIISLVAALMLTAGRPLAFAVEVAHPEEILNRQLNEQVIRIPTEAPPVVTLEVTVMHPNGPGPFPLAIMNHGASNISSGNRGDRYHLTNTAFYFLSRGYAVALPMMRGFAASGGQFYHFGCDLSATGIANAKDIRSVIRYLAADPRFDTSRVIVAGQSFGGWNTLALGALNVPNVTALINFNGGIESSDCDADSRSLIAAAGIFGAHTKIPSLWFYGQNDSVFPVSTWRAMYDNYVRAGGNAELVNVGVFMADSHQFLAFPESLPLWVPQIDKFLKQIGMPSTELNAGYLPEQFPPPTGFAAITDVAAIPYLSQQSRDMYRDFLQLPFPRAFVIDNAGTAVSQSGGLDPLGRAMAICHTRKEQCGVYAVDASVVWKPFPVADQQLPVDKCPHAPMDRREASHSDRCLLPSRPLVLR
jgi:dienelactone hydrolase